MDDTVNNSPSTVSDDSVISLVPKEHTTSANIKKRTFDECDTSTNDEPQRKKHKSDNNYSDISNELNTLLQSNKLLTVQNHELTEQSNNLKHENGELSKENMYYKQSVTAYKKELNRWKVKYKKLQSSQFQSNNATNANGINQSSDNKIRKINIECPTNNRSLLLSNLLNITFEDRPTIPIPITNPVQCTEKQRTDTQNTVSTTHDPDTCTQFVDFEDSYYVSVDCHVCEDSHFSDITLYREHLKEHYHSDPNKQWLICDLGCKRGKIDGSQKFIGHIATHHTKDRPFKCKCIANGVKCDKTYGYKSDQKIHWKKNHCSQAQLQRENRNKRIRHKPKKKRKSVPRNKQNLLEQYSVSVDCHVCSDKHYSDFSKYVSHMEKHYKNDANKTWKQCDLGCERPLFSRPEKFVSHLSQHTNDKPFKCDYIKDGIKCDKSYGSKYSVQCHLRSHSKNDQNINTQNIKPTPKLRPKPKIKKQRSTPAFVDTDFESSYVISVNCHVCKSHFDDLGKYQTHLESHYGNDQRRQWLKCDLGCENLTFEGKQYHFICHIASHTKDYPFQCNISVNGKQCTFSASTRSNLKTHFNRLHNVNYIRNGKGKGKRCAEESESESEESELSESEESESESSDASDNSESESEMEEYSDSESVMESSDSDGSHC